MSKIVLYVDGACRGNPGLGGWGVYWEQDDGQIHQYCGGEVETTNNRMELTAAIEGILQCPLESDIQIFTDSIYVKRGITEWIEGWEKRNWKNVKNQDLWIKLKEVSQHRKITWQWIKGHAGHFGNEKADQLANRGADLIQQDPKLAHQVFLCDTEQPIKVNPHENITTLQPEDWLLHDPFGLQIQEEEENDIHNQNQAIDQATLNDEHVDSVKKPKEKTKRSKNKRSKMTQEQVLQYVSITPATKKINGHRQLILDTETTGFQYHQGDRIIEVGAIEMINRKLTGSSIHIYIQPEKEIGEEAIKVHGLTNEFLKDKPIFSEIATILYEYLKGAEIIAHNAVFDIGFLDAEFERVGLGKLSDVCSVIDTLQIAKTKHPGQRNTLDALAKRYAIQERDRTFHGALLDSEILADVYLAMTGGQVAFDIAESVSVTEQYAKVQAHLIAVLPTEEELKAHQQWQQQHDKKYPDVKPTLFYQLEHPKWQDEYNKRQSELEQE